MTKHTNRWSTKIVAGVIAPILLLAGFGQWVNALQRTDTDTTAPSSPANNVGYDPVTPGDWTTVPREVGSALDSLAAGGGGGGDTHPMVQTTDLVKGTVDATKLARINTDTNVPTATSVTVSWPAANLDLGTAVTAAAAFGTDNVILRSDGTGRGAQLTGCTISDGDNITLPGDTHVFGDAAVGSLVLLQFKNSGAGTGQIKWLNATPAAFRFDDAVELAGDIVDSMGLDVLKFAEVASAVNEVTIANAATTNDPSITASGETNVGIIIASKGTGVVSIPGVGTGGLTDYDLTIGNTSDYGIMQVGDFAFGRSSYNAGAVDFDGTVLFRSLSAPATSPVEFAFAMTGGTSLRFAIAKAAVGNATYNSRSLLCAGPAPASTAAVTVGYWQGTGIFDNLVCDTAGDGADVGVQNDLEVEGDIFVDSILESTTDAGVTIEGVPIENGEVDGRNVADLLAFFNGTFIESFDALVTSDGATVTMSLEQTGGGDLTMQFSDGQTTLDCTPAATIGPTTGSDASPTGNFIYVPQSTKVLTKSTADWPSAEHIKIAYLLVPSPGYVQTNGAYVNHNTNDHAKGTDNQGHLSHMTERLRSQSAIHKSGAALTMTIGGGATVDVAVTSGIIYQMHKHATPALDTATGDAVLVINQNGVAYDDVTNLETLTNDATGAAVKKYFNWTFVGVGNKGGEYSPLMMNLPTGSYNQLASAEADVSGFDVLTIPGEFSGDSQTGFLIARVTMSLIGGTWAHVSTVDLRGATPQTVVGGVGGVDTEFADNAFKLFNVTDNTKILDFQLSGLTTGNTRTITMADQNIDLAPDTGTFAGNPLTADLDAASFDIDNWHTLDGLRDGGRCLVKATSYGDEARWVSQRAEGSLGSPSAVGVNDVLGSFTLNGYDGTAFRARAYFEAIVDGAVSAGVVPTAMRMRVGGGSPTEAWRTGSDGDTLVASNREWQFRAATNRIYSPSAGLLHLGGNSGTVIDVGANTLIECVANTIRFDNSGGAKYGDIYVGTATELQIRDSAAAAKVRISTTGIAFYATAPVAQHAAMTALTDFIVPATAPSPADFTIRTLVDSSVGANWGFASDDEGHTVLAAIRNLQDRVDELEAMLAASTGVGIHGG